MVKTVIFTVLYLQSLCHPYKPISFFTYIRVGQKKWTVLRVDNFAKVGSRNVYDMSKFSIIYLEKNIKLACQCIKYSLPNLHKYSLSLKLR